MTLSHLSSRIALAAALPLALLSCGDARGEGGFRSDQDTIQVVSAVVGGKNVFIPSTLVAVEGETRKLSVYNGAEIVHGFAIEGLGIEEVLQPGVEHEIALPKIEGGRVYRIHCHLHPAHRTATLVVHEAAAD